MKSCFSRARTLVLLMLWMLFIIPNAHASDLFEIITILSKIAGSTMSIQNTNLNELVALQALNKGLMGMHSYGSLYGSNAAFGWGESADTWQGLLSLYRQGGGGVGNSSLFSIMRTVANQFPMNDHLNSPNEIENTYYRLQAQTTAVSRSSSELVFDQVTREANTLAALQSEIDRTSDAKSAMDLHTRFSAEQANLTVQQTKLLALLVQQVATDAQEKSNRANEDAHFFNYS
ncbi:MAG: Legionella vir ue protein [Gammaproteobacteria bacterium]|jgi:hypothetical protein|nr:Legionella vir ue protein [Gammaproteobacteria bacterium]